MNEVVTFLNENPVQYLATVGRDGKAKCRPFMFAGEMDSRLWFCTNNQKEVYKDMQANPCVEISVSSPTYAWIRLNGKAVFEDSLPAKEMCLQNPVSYTHLDVYKRQSSAFSLYRFRWIIQRTRFYNAAAVSAPNVHAIRFSPVPNPSNPTHRPGRAFTE